MLSLRVATRFLRTSPVQSLLIITGIAVGIAVQIFVSSLITSLQANLLASVVGTSPHVTMSAEEDGEPLRLTESVYAVINDDERVEDGAVVPVRLSAGLYTDGEGSAPLNLKGGTLEELDTIYDIESRIIKGEWVLGPDDIMVGTGFAEEYSVEPGEDIVLILPDNKEVRLTVTATLDFGQGTANERQTFVGSELTRSVLGHSADEYSAVEVQLVEPFDSIEVAADWSDQLGAVTIDEWQANSGDLLEGLQAQGSSSLMIQVFVMIAVALGIAATLAISAVQKTRQIGILKALGMKDRDTGLVFLWEGAILGVLGTALGIGFGVGLISLFYVIPVPFMIDILPDKFIISGAVGMSVALLSAILPYRKTAALDPIEVINGG